MDFAGKQIVVVGLGRTGVALTRFFSRKKARVVATDKSFEKDLESVIPELLACGARLELGGHRLQSFRKADLVAISPGVPHDLPELEAARSAGVPVVGEIEWAFRMVREPVVAVTGTNGKTTATSLLGRMLSESGFRVFVGGNIGNPLIGYVDRGDSADRIVLEVSSFQLDTIDTFRPAVAVLLNTTEDHLDRYPDMKAYAASKRRIFENQLERDIAILNGRDPWLRFHMEGVRSRKHLFHADGPGNAGIRSDHISWFLNDESVRFFLPRPDGNTADAGEFRVDLKQARLQGPHNMENICAAAMAALAAGATPEGIQSAVNGFAGLSHRMTPIGTFGGVTYIDDSKATNVDAVIRALECFEKPVILILGGRDKASPFPALREPVSRHARHVILLGEASESIRRVLDPKTPVTVVGSMREVVTVAKGIARPGETVLLSPACASFDMFTSYGHRGDVFRAEVERLRHES
jgi:UDP-N-acetylmuramoylalanine--D-glutamate ligase